MKQTGKKVLFLLLMVMVFVGLSHVEVFADDAYDVWVGGTQVTSANASDVSGNGTVSYDVNTKTLSLNNYTYSGIGYEKSAIYATGDLTINVAGTNTLTSTEASGFGIYTGGALTVTGSGTTPTLNVNANNTSGYSIKAAGASATFTGATVNLAGNRGIVVNEDNTSDTITITNCKINFAEGMDRALQVWNGAGGATVSITGSKLTGYGRTLITADGSIGDTVYSVHDSQVQFTGSYGIDIESYYGDCLVDIDKSTVTITASQSSNGAINAAARYQDGKKVEVLIKNDSHVSLSGALTGINAWTWRNSFDGDGMDTRVSVENSQLTATGLYYGISAYAYKKGDATIVFTNSTAELEGTYYSGIELCSNSSYNCIGNKSYTQTDSDVTLTGRYYGLDVDISTNNESNTDGKATISVSGGKLTAKGMLYAGGDTAETGEVSMSNNPEVSIDMTGIAYSAIITDKLSIDSGEYFFTYYDDDKTISATEYNITGGTFDNAPDYVAEGYEAKQNTDGTWEIVHGTAVVNGITYEDFQQALAAVTKDTPMTSVTEALWPSATPVYAVVNGTGAFYSSIDPAAVGGMANALAGYTAENYTTAELTIYCRPGATISKTSHSAIFGNVTIYGNGASLGGAWEPCPEYSTSGYPTMTKDVSISIYNLDDGAAVWGIRCTDYTLNVVMENCQNAHEIMLNGSAGSSDSITNITVKNCTFICPPSGYAHTGVIIATTNPGAIVVDNCTFTDSNTNFAININNKNGGTNNVTISECTFTNCGNTGKSAVRICGEAEAATLSATLSNLTFTSCDNKCDIEIGKGGSADENLSAVSYVVSGTAGDLYVYTQNTADTIKNEGSTALSSSETYTGSNKSTFQIDAANKEAIYSSDGISIPVDGMFTIPNGAGTATYAVAPDDTGDSAGEGTYAEGKLTVSKCGTFIVTVTTAETDTYDAATATAKLTVNKADPTATAPTGLTATYGQTLADVALTNPTGNTPGTWAWAVATTTRVGDVGDNMFKADFTPTDTANYNAKSNVDVTVTVRKAVNPLTYVAAQTVSKTFSTTAQTATLAGATNAQGSVSYAIYSQKDSSDQTVQYFSLNGTTLTIAANTPAGTYTVVVRATAAGNDNYYAKIKYSTVTVTVGKANPTATAPTGLTGTYGQTLADVTLTNPEGNTPGSWAWVDSSTSVGTVGSHTFKANFTPTDTTNYKTVENVDVTVTVGKMANPATVSGSATVMRGGNTVNLAGNVTKNGATGAVSYEISGAANGCSLNGSVLTSGSSTGSVTVNVTVAADDIYNALAATPITVTITDKNTQTITASDVTATYGDTGKSINAITDGGGALSYAVKSGDAVTVDPSTGALTIVKAGNAVITVTAAETATYAQATRDVNVTVNTAAAVVTKAPTAKTLTYNGQAQELVTAGEATGGTMQYALGTDAATAPEDNLYTTSIPTATNAGTYYVWYMVKGDGDHADTVPTCVTATVTEPAVIIPDASVTFTGGSLRRRVNTNTSDVVDFCTDMRLEFKYDLPEGAIIDTNNSYFYWSTRSNTLERKVRIKYFYDNSCALVICNIPKASYGTSIYAKASIVYTLNGTKYSISATGTRTVNQICNILRSDTDTWADYARYLLGEVDSYTP